MIVTLSKTPSELEIAFLKQTLRDEDALLLTSSALPLMFQNNPTEAQGYILSDESNKFGGRPEQSWKLLSSSAWVEMLETQDKNISW
jgi:sulfur transfer complex TusBCD TusB component (DsrH family)